MEDRNRTAERLRRGLAVLTVLVTALYLWWRLTETFNPDALLFSWMLWGAEAFSALTASLFFFTVWQPDRRPPPPPGGARRSIDVFVTTKSESVGVLRQTLIACRDLRLPHRTLVLDDGDRPEVRALCEETGCEYLARPDHDHAKAGNLNYGLQHSDAELVAVFDADHVPLPHFLERLIGYFQDESLAYVQTPHEFRNIDSFQHHVDPENRRIWAEQDFFFSLIQPGRDHWNAAYFVGSCAVLRRSALDEIGGFASASVTEDLLTSILLHGKGWSSAYHDEPLAYGLAPETFLPFRIQRRRWGIGAWQVLFKANPLLLRGLTVPQRLCYLASIIYPFEGFQKLVFYLTPPAVLFTGVLPVRALDIEYLLHFVPYYILSIFAFNEMGRGFGGTLMLERYSMGKFAIYIESLFVFVRRRASAGFQVTPKGSHDRTPWSLILPQLAITAFSFLTVAWGLGTLLANARQDEFVVAVNCLWALYNSGLGLSVIQTDRGRPRERREEFRIPDSVPILYRPARGPQFARPRLGVARDLTPSSARLFGVDELPVGSEILLDFVLPTGSVNAAGTIVRRVEPPADLPGVATAGIQLGDTVPFDGDALGRYLHAAAVRKYLGGYSRGYHTAIGRWARKARKERPRAERLLASLPAVVGVPSGRRTFGVVRDISRSGALVLAREAVATGDPLTIDVHVGNEVVVVRGEAVRSRPHESPEYPEYQVGLRLDPEVRTGVDRILEVVRHIRRRSEK